MDVRTKFVLALAGIAVIVIAMLAAIYLATTTGPFEEEPSAIVPVAVEPGDALLGADTPQDTTTEGGSEERDRGTVATITLEDGETPSKQLNKDESVETGNKNTVTYTVNMRASWSKRLHQEWYPRGAHLSPMVTWSHYLKDAVFKVNAIASDGMEVMAESGGTKTIERELEDLKNQGYVFEYAFGKKIDAPGEDATTVSLSKNAPYISVVSMIAPSPDWFIAAQNVALFEDNAWLEKKTVAAALYDAGTDNGTTFTTYNSDTRPPRPITAIADAPLVPIAVFEFVKN